MSNNKPMSDVLYDLALEQRPFNAELIEEYVQQYSEYAQEITDFAIDLAIDKLRTSCTTNAYEAQIDKKTSPTVSKAISHFHNRLYELTNTSSPKTDVSTASSTSMINPFSDLAPPSFKNLAKSLNVTSLFLTKLRDKIIEPATIPLQFLQRLSEAMRIDVDALNAYFKKKPNVGASGQYYKSEGKPQVPKKQTFEEAVKSSGLSDEIQKDLLSL